MCYTECLEDKISLVLDPIYEYVRQMDELKSEHPEDRAQTVEDNEDLKECLETIPKAIHDNHGFLYRGKRIRDIRSGLIEACKKSGIIYGQKVKDGFIFHDLRHTFNTNMRKAGVAESVIMAITGHSTREMFDRYNTVDKKDMRQGIKKMGSFMTNVTRSVTLDIKKGS